MSMYWIIFIGFALLSWLVSSRLKNKFEKYSKIPMPNGMTGKDVARTPVLRLRLLQPYVPLRWGM